MAITYFCLERVGLPPPALYGGGLEEVPGQDEQSREWWSSLSPLGY